MTALAKNRRYRSLWTWRHELALQFVTALLLAVIAGGIEALSAFTAI